MGSLFLVSGGLSSFVDVVVLEVEEDEEEEEEAFSIAVRPPSRHKFRISSQCFSVISINFCF